MKLVRLEKVSRAYGRTFALHRVSTTFESGSATALLGGNGAGKTTLLNILATLDAPTQGEVHYDALSWAQVTRRARRSIGWVGHDPLLYANLSGAENLTFYARMYGLSDIHDLTQGLLERVGMADAHDRLVRDCSRGMVQRLTLARALLHDPALVLLDEPLTGLDRAGRADLSKLFDMLRSQGKILILSTHDLATADALCDRALFLRRGRVAHDTALTSPGDLLSAYEEYA